MYVKGTSRMDDFLKSTRNNSTLNSANAKKSINNCEEPVQKLKPTENHQKNGEEAPHLQEKCNNDQPDIHSIWNSHEDLIAVSSNGMEIILFFLIKSFYKY